MEISKRAMFFVLNGEEYTGPSPSGNPSNLFIERYGGVDKWRVLWDNGDATAYTRVYYGITTVSFADSTLLKTELPGATFSDSGLEAGIQDPPEPATQYRFWLVHYKNGAESDTPVFIVTTGF